MTASVFAPDERLREIWEYYWLYTRTRTDIHAAATAALTAFGLLAYFHQGFVFLAFAAYVLPPLYLYVTTDGGARAQIRTENENTDTDPEDTDADGTDTDSDADGTDTDSDADGTDTDSDMDGSDMDTDG